MKSLFGKHKNWLINIIVIFLAVLFLFIANRVVTKGETVFGKFSVAEVYPARVAIVLAENIDENEISTETTVFFEAKITGGNKKGEFVNARQHISTLYQVQYDKVAVGDKIILRYTEYGTDHKIWLFQNTDRSMALLGLLIAFFIFLILIGGRQGAITIFSLILTCSCVFLYFIPAIIREYNIYLTTAITCLFVITVTLILINGVNFKSLSAGIGCIGGLLSAGLIYKVMESFLALTGIVDEQSEYLLIMGNIDLKAIIFSSILIGVLGGVLDVGVSLASSLSEIYPEGDEHSFASIVRSGMNIGRDIISTMTNTLMLVFIGGALPTAILLTVYSNSFLELISREAIVVEILQALIGSIGLMFTIPITAALYAFGATRKKQGNPNKQKILKESLGNLENVVPLKARNLEDMKNQKDNDHKTEEL